MIFSMVCVYVHRLRRYCMVTHTYTPFSADISIYWEANAFELASIQLENVANMTLSRLLWIQWMAKRKEKKRMISYTFVCCILRKSSLYLNSFQYSFVFRLLTIGFVVLLTKLNIAQFIYNICMHKPHSLLCWQKRRKRKRTRGWKRRNDSKWIRATFQNDLCICNDECDLSKIKIPHKMLELPFGLRPTFHFLAYFIIHMDDMQNSGRQSSNWFLFKDAG